MKNLRKAQFGLLAVLLAVGVVFGMSAFKTKVAPQLKTSTYWRFDSTDISDLRDYTKYVKITDPEAPSCEEGNDLPCVLEAPASVNTPALLDAHLNNTSIFSNDQAIIDASMYKKEAPVN